MSISIKLEGFELMANYFKDYVARKKNGLLAVVADTSQKITQDAIAQAPYDLNELRSNIRSTIIERKNNISGDVLSAAPYSAFVEFGTRAHTPPYKALQGWSDRHGIPVGAVVNKISREGTPAQPFMLPAAIKNKNEFVRNIVTVMSTK